MGFLDNFPRLSFLDRVSHSDNGWTDNKLGYKWKVKDFDCLTKDKANGKTQVLLLDGHSSHYSHELLHYAEQNNIIILGYPPHCTHALQGLDVVCFAKMKDVWHQKIQEYERAHNGAGISKSEFVGIWGETFLEAFTKKLVTSAFKATGIHPFNPAVVTETQMKPSLATSTTAHFPMPLASPVKAILTSLRSHPVTSFDIERAQSPVPPVQIDPTLLCSPLTPRRRWRSNENMPEDDTPSKRMRLMTCGLAGTCSGSLLLSKTPLLSTYTPIPTTTARLPPKPPVTNAPPTDDDIQKENLWLREQLGHTNQHVAAYHETNAGLNAQLVIQNVELRRLTTTIHNLEEKKKKKKDKSKLSSDGMGRHLTNPEFIALLKADHDAKLAAEVDKQVKAAEREAKKAEKERLEVEWKAIKAAHKLKVAEWEANCARLTAAGVWKRDHPAKPKHPKKPKSSVADEEEPERPDGTPEGGDESDNDEFGAA